MVPPNASECSSSPPVSVSGTVHALELFPGPLHPRPQSVKGARDFAAVTSSGPRNVDLVPIGYGSRPRLRGRLTLRGLALRRNPWTSGGRGSRSACRYSCPHSHFRPLHRPSRVRLRRWRNAPLPRASRRAHGFGARLEPRYIFAAGQLVRPVSYYAFFKGWLLLSQPPGCFGRPTCFPTEPGLGGLSRWSGLFPSRRRTLAPAVCLPPCAPRHSEFGRVW
jgi:hypothetical protein